MTPAEREQEARRMLADMTSLCGRLESRAAQFRNPAAYRAQGDIRAAGDVPAPVRHVRLTIVGRPVSANVLLRMHWTKRAQLARQWYYPTLMAYQAAGSPRFERPVVTVTSVFGSHGRRDADNYAAGAKLVLDHLTALGAWADDSAIVSLTSRVEVRRGVWQLEIEIEEAG